MSSHDGVYKAASGQQQSNRGGALGESRSGWSSLAGRAVALFHDKVAIQSLFAADAVESCHLDCDSQCALVWDEEIWIIYEEN